MDEKNSILHDKLSYRADKAEKQIQSQKLAGGCCGCLAVIFITLAIIGSCQVRRNFFITPAMSDNEVRKISTDVGHLDSAADAAKKYVQKELLAPTSAQFPTVDATWVTDNYYKVILEVDSHNYFGVMIRGSYTVELEYLGDGNWKLIKLIQNK